MDAGMDDDVLYLKKPQGRRVWMYRRGVPKHLRLIDKRWPTVTISTKTRDIHAARQVRDILAKADDDYWEALDAGLDATTAQEKYEAAILMREAKGAVWLDKDLTYGDLVESGDAKILEKRFNEAWRAALGKPIGRGTQAELDDAKPVADLIMAGTLGNVDAPEPAVREACRIWIDEMITHEWQDKSPEQLRNWRNPIDRAVKNFETVVSRRKPYLTLTRQDVLKFHGWLNKRVINKEISASTANRDFGVLRRMWTAHANYNGLDVPNPFRDLSWTVKDVKRPAFSVDWIKNKFLTGNGLAGLNQEARRVLLVLIETGCRPSEIANLQPENIHLDHDVPHIHIRSMPGLEIKTTSSQRKIPLVGVALETMKKLPDGFPKYFDRGSAYSALVNKYLKNNNLNETAAHTVYGLRHSFETRAKAAQFDYELRLQLMGHTSTRPDYGEGFTLSMMQSALEGIALPFDADVI